MLGAQTGMHKNILSSPASQAQSEPSVSLCPTVLQGRGILLETTLFWVPLLLWSILSLHREVHHSKQYVSEQKCAKGWVNSLPWMRGSLETGLTSVSQRWPRAAEDLTCCSNFAISQASLGIKSFAFSIASCCLLHCFLVCSSLYFWFILPMDFDFLMFILL